MKLFEPDWAGPSPDYYACGRCEQYGHWAVQDDDGNLVAIFPAGPAADGKEDARKLAAAFVLQVNLSQALFDLL